MIIAMMMNLLSGAMVIINVKFKSKSKRRTPVRYLVSRFCDGLVHVGRREEALEVTEGCVLSKKE